MSIYDKRYPIQTGTTTPTKRFIEKAIGKGYMEYAGDELDRIIPPISRRHGEREKKKESVLDKIRRLVEVFVGI